MSETKKIRFTFIDALIVLVVVAVIVFVGYKFFGKEVAKNTDASTTYKLSFYIEEAPDFAAANIEKGCKVSDEAKKIPLGNASDVTIGDSVFYTTNQDGDVIKSSREGYNSIKITTEVQALETDHGIKVDGTEYVVGHSMTIYAGKAKIYGRVSGIEKK